MRRSGVGFTSYLSPSQSHRRSGILGFADTLKDDGQQFSAGWFRGASNGSALASTLPLRAPATAGYLDAQDAIGAWLEECCEIDPNSSGSEAPFMRHGGWATAAEGCRRK